MEALRQKLAARLQRRLRRRLHLTIHDNRRVMLSFRERDDGAIALRLHHMFLAAGPSQLDAVIAYVRRKERDARRAIETFIARFGHLIGVPLQEPSRGRVHDLARIYRELNDRHFGGRVRAQIAWGRRVKRERKRTIRLGYYCDVEKKIVISPTLDRRSVPRFFLEWIVFHEMLHQIVGFTRIGGALVAHTPEFRRREQAFPRYARASAWETANLSRLLRA